MSAGNENSSRLAELTPTNHTAEALDQQQHSPPVMLLDRQSSIADLVATVSSDELVATHEQSNASRFVNTGIDSPVVTCNYCGVKFYEQNETYQQHLKTHFDSNILLFTIIL